MPAVQEQQRIDEIALKWHDLADRRLSYFIELYRSGRWQRYYTREDFAARMADVIKAKKAWDSLAYRAIVERNAARDGKSRLAA